MQEGTLHHFTKPTAQLRGSQYLTRQT